jgi:hypothetical protein
MNGFRQKATLACGLIWAGLFIGARLVLDEPGHSLGARALLAFGPSLPLLGFMAGALVMSRRVDEMERRVQLEAFATAFGLTILLIATLALAQRAGFRQVRRLQLRPSHAHAVHVLPRRRSPGPAAIHMRTRMKVLRAERGITQAELAEQVGAARQTINSIEGGKVRAKPWPWHSYRKGAGSNGGGNVHPGRRLTAFRQHPWRRRSHLPSPSLSLPR